MNSNTRLIVNTLAQNVRTVINIVLSLYSTRIVMEALGESDYGIYMLVAGIVSLLNYVCNTLVTTTQRFLSYANGAGRQKEEKLVFANSYMLHWLTGLVLAALFAIPASWIFDGHTLNIPPERLEEAEVVYYFVIVTVVITFITAPFRALLISHENIVYISIVDVLDGLLKLGLVFSLFLVDSWRLPLYAMVITSVMSFNFIMLAGYSHFRYEESTLIPRIGLWDKTLCRKLMGFATWTLYGTGCVYIRTQGVAVIINKMLGTLANAAFGIATQVHGSLQFLSVAIGNAISPQIIKAEGEGNRPRAILLTLMAAKYSFLLLAIAAIPIIAEMPLILQLWLGRTPEYAVFLCRMMLISSLIDRTTLSLGTLNQAIGRIRNYTLITFTIKVLCIPVSILCIYMGSGIYVVIYVYLIFELLSAIIRVPILIHTAGLKLQNFMGSVIIRLVLPVVVMSGISWTVCHSIPPVVWRFLITGCASAFFGLIVIWFTAMENHERLYITNLILKRLRHDEAPTIIRKS